MTRPYFRLGAKELEDLFEQNRTDPTILKQLKDELGHRKTARAKKLLENVEKGIKKLTSTPTQRQLPPNKPQAPRHSAAEPKVTQNINSKNEIEPYLGNQSESTFDVNSDVLDSFVNALAIEVEAIQKNSRETKIDLYNGKKVDQSIDTYMYRFPLDDEIHMRDDAPIRVSAGGKESSGTVVSIIEKAILIALDVDFGDRIQYAQITTDDSYLVERLREKLAKLKQGEGISEFNLEMFHRVLGKGKISVSEANTDVDLLEGLNASQQTAIAKALGSQVLYLWGPPGTGKTHVLARIIDGYYRQGKKLLVVSNTNLAVDTLLEKLCHCLSARGDVGFHGGAVIRYGTIVKEELRSDFEDYVNLDEIVKRLSQQLVDEREQKQNKKYRLGGERNALDRVIEDFNKLETFQRALPGIEKEITNLNSAIRLQGRHNEKLDEEHQLLNEKFNKALRAGVIRSVFPGANPEKIKSKIDSNRKERVNNQEALVANGINLDKLDKQKAEYEKIISKLRVDLAGKDKKQVIDQIDSITTQIKELENRISQIDTELGKLREEIIHNCKILCATATQTYLKEKDFKKFDVAVIDEASMLLLPATAYVSGLSTGNVIIAGDFRQLPPIVISGDDTVKDWVGKDIFNAAQIEDAVNRGNSPSYMAKLNIQYRMDDRICSLINEKFYLGDLQTGEGAGSEDKTRIYPQILSNSLIFIDTSSKMPFANTKPRTWSRYNVLHAFAIRNLVYRLARGGLTNSKDMGVITPYSAQAKLIGKFCKDLGLDQLEAGTVHRYQGNEKDVVILDFCDSWGVWNASRFVKASTIYEDGAKLLNVAVSRARSYLVVFANLQYLTDKISRDAILLEMIHRIKSIGEEVDINDVLAMGPAGSFFDIDSDELGPIGYEANTSVPHSERSFDKAFIRDLKSSKQQIVIFSPFATPNRVAVWADVLREKLAQGVKIRIVTRAPGNQGSISEDATKQALYPLMDMGVVVDYRHNMHEKLCFIDDHIFWSGSLNPLSHTGKTNEIMTRTDSKVACESIAELVSFARLEAKKDVTFIEGLAEQENPRCENCDSMTIFHTHGRYGPYFECLGSCGWKINLDRARKSRNRALNSKRTTIDEPPSDMQSKICPICNNKMVVRSGRYGKFWGCSGYPKCRHTEKI